MHFGKSASLTSVSLTDGLPSVSQLSMILQKSDMDISCVYPCVSGLQSKLKEARKGSSYYQSTLKEQLGRKKDGDGKIIELSYKGRKLHDTESMTVEKMKGNAQNAEVDEVPPPEHCLAKWVIVEYDQKPYPGYVQDVDGAVS